MEAAPRLPGLDFDLKLSIESVNLCEKIPQYIVSHYNESNEDYHSEFEQINRLRQNAVHCGVDESSVQCLKRYYCQLLLLRNRFPMLPENECAVRFTWEDAFQKEENCFSDIRFEEANILYNLASIYSKLGANESRKTHESMKTACTYYRCAAACLERVRDQYTTYSIDFTPDLLSCQIDILLGQAHEAVLEKSQLDQRPASVNAHVAMQIAEYYRQALTNLMKNEVLSISSRVFREWRVSLTYKSAFYTSLAYFYGGLLAEETKKRGEAVSYFENAVEQLKDAWKNATKISSDKSSIFKESYSFALELFSEKFKIAKRDNDSVYFEKVPSLSSLPTIQGAVVAKPQMFDYQDPNVSGPDIFQRLIPMNVHLALSEYSEEKAKLLRDIVELVDEKDRQLETFLKCLQIDRMPLNHEYLRLPREFLDCSAAAATRPTMSKDFAAVMQQLNSQHHDIVDKISECQEFLVNLRKNAQYSSSSSELNEIENEIETLSQLMLKANETNTDLHRHMTIIIEHLNLLHSSVEQVEENLPKIIEIDDETLKPKFARLGLLYEKIETMKSQRTKLIKEFRQKLHDDDITKMILIQKQENYKNLFTSQMKKHEELIAIIKQNCRAQENIIQSVTELNADLAEVRPKIVKQYESRQRLIQDCIKSFSIFDETLAKAYEGMEFYKKQSEKVDVLNQRLLDIQKKESKKIIEQAATPPKPVADVVRPRLKDYLPLMKPQSWGSTQLAQNDQSVFVPTNPNYPNGYQAALPQATMNYPMPYFQNPPLMQPSHPAVSYPMATSVPYQSMPYQTGPPIEQNLNGPSFYQNQTYFPQAPAVSVAQPTHQPYVTNPSVFNPQDVYRPTPRNFTSTNKFDPYRPQPVGAYDIPQVPGSNLNPQDTYYRAAYLGMNPNPSNNIPPYDQNQYVPTNSFANLSLNSMLNH